MAGTPVRMTATGFVNLPGGTASGPCILESLLITALTDNVDVTLYDTRDLDVRPIASARVMGRILVSTASSDSFYLCARFEHGIRVVVNTGTVPEMFFYIQ